MSHDPTMSSAKSALPTSGGDRTDSGEDLLPGRLGVDLNTPSRGISAAE